MADSAVFVLDKQNDIFILLLFVQIYFDFIVADLLAVRTLIDLFYGIHVIVLGLVLLGSYLLLDDVLLINAVEI